MRTWTALMGFCMILSGCGSAQQSGNNDVAAEPTPVNKTVSNLRESFPDLFACTDDAECTTAPKGGCNNGILEAVRHDSVDRYTRLARQHRHTACTYIYVDDYRTPHCHPERHQCELKSQQSAQR